MASGPWAAIKPLTESNQPVTVVTFILDRSGSMANKARDVIGGVNAYVQNLKGDFLVSLVLFDDEVETLWERLPLDAVPELTSQEYFARGSTALLDAVGKTVAGLQAAPHEHHVVVTMTDGEENASREYTKDAVAALMKDREGAQWSFVFMGDDLDKWDDKNQLGYAVGNTLSYSGSQGATASTFAGLAASTSQLSSEGWTYQNSDLVAKHVPGVQLDAATGTYQTPAPKAKKKKA